DRGPVPSLGGNGVTLVDNSLLAELERIGPVRRDYPLAARTSWKIGGPADLYLRVGSLASLCAAVRAGWESGTPVFLLGNGSNLLVSDLGIRGLVVENTAETVIELERTADELLVRVESGMPIAKLANRLARAGWAGLEWAVGIPGAVGGAIVSNAGAHGGVTSEVVVAVRLLTQHDGTIQLPAAELGFGYRSSNFLTKWRHEMGSRVVLSVDFRLRASAPDDVVRLAAQHKAHRNATQPVNQPSCGSVFTNPTGDSAGRLIEQAGLKGQRIGGAEISTKHANFIVNRGGARASDAEALIRLARSEVLRQFGVALRPEVERVGEGLSKEWSA
ncbi:MAG: UDP-N-acetylmuramate dehydrogenase, partial [Chloroflexi bacterium]|nr:UDP-N-acetylmuramate dehydrogenase [Chloroflexota bacterium]